MREHVHRAALTREEAVALQEELRQMVSDLDARVVRGEPEISLPFRMLEGTELLRCIVQHLGPGDAMCAAFACRMLRDAVFDCDVGRTAAERTHPYDLRRFGRTATTAEQHIMSVSRFDWARANGGMVRSAHDSSVCDAAAQQGRLDVLKAARALDYQWSTRTTAQAARHGHLELLVHMRIPPYT